jgi:beta-barrel assembly-enhancing protease
MLSNAEANLWKDGVDFEKALDENPMTYRNPALEKYMNQVLSNLIKDKEIIRRYKPHVHIIKNPLLNAVALPNGAILIHSAILARLENEAQLSLVLGHELVHFMNRHAYRSLQNEIAAAREKTAVTVFFSAITLLTIPNVTGAIGAHWELAAISGYSRELEREADESALVLMAEAGYNPREAIAVFRLLKKEYDPDAAKESFYYGSHPLLNERIENAKSFMADHESTLSGMKMKKISDVDYTRRIADLLLDNADQDIEQGRFRTAEMAVQKHLAANPMSYRGHYIRGKLITQLNKGPESSGLAMQAYKLSVSLNPNYPLPHRELGLLYIDRGQRGMALYEFNQYLMLAKNPVDGPIIRQYINALSK